MFLQFAYHCWSVTRWTRTKLRLETLEGRDCPAVVFENDYSQDVNGFFTPERRALLEFAEQQLMPYLQDDLSAITPDPSRGNTWSIQFQNTATGQNVVIDNPTIPANVIQIYAWGAPQANFPQSTNLATGGQPGANMQGYPPWFDTINARGQAGRLASPATDTSVYAIRIDVNQDARYYESTTPPPDGADPDLVSVLEHELLHGLGLTGSNPAVARWVNEDRQFVGPHVVALAGGPVQTSASHWAPGTTVNGVPALLNPVITNRRLTPLDTAALADIGWESSLPAPPPQTIGNAGETTGPGDPPSDPAGPLTGRFAISQDRGGDVAAIGNPNGTPALVVTPFPDFAGGVRSALADFNRDGIPDLVAGTGPGAPTLVRILDGRDEHELFAISPFEAAFTGGVYVAAGDLNGDQVPDLVITPDEGGGPRCRVFSGKDNFAPLADFLGIADPNFRGGARPAVGDVNGDGVGDLIVAAGFGGGPRVAGYDGRTVRFGATPAPVFADFFAFEDTLRNGVFIAAGDVDGDGFADLVIGAGPGGGPRVLALSGQALVGGRQLTLGDFFAGDPSTRGGIHVTAKDLNADGRSDIITGSGENSGTRLDAYNSAAMSPTGGTPPTLLSRDFSKRFNSGLFVG
jgi:hypothetical protein